MCGASMHSLSLRCVVHSETLWTTARALSSTARSKRFAATGARRLTLCARRARAPNWTARAPPGPPPAARMIRGSRPRRRGPPRPTPAGARCCSARTPAPATAAALAAPLATRCGNSLFAVGLALCDSFLLAFWEFCVVIARTVSARSAMACALSARAPESGAHAQAQQSLAR